MQDDNDIEEFYVADLLQGSYRRWTALKPQKDEKSDADIALVTELSSDIDAVVALEMCEPFLDKHYEGQWSPNARSYKIEEDEVEIDLVLTAAPSEATRGVVNSLNSLDVGAALSEDESKDSLSTVAGALNITAEGDDEWRNEPLEIPNRDENEWENTHPLATIAFTVAKTTSQMAYVNVVKALKWWRRTKTPNVEGPTSYPLEHIVGHCCPNDIDSVAEGVTRTLEEIKRQFETQAIANETRACLLTASRGHPSIVSSSKSTEKSSLHSTMKRRLPQT